MTASIIYFIFDPRKEGCACFKFIIRKERGNQPRGPRKLCGGLQSSVACAWHGVIFLRSRTEFLYLAFCC